MTERRLLPDWGMRHLVPALALALLAACSDSHTDDGGGDAFVPMDASADLGATDAGRVACETVSEGEPCAPEGTYCETECDPCSFCNVLTCTEGTWTRVEAFPPPPEVCFDCSPGGLRCLRGSAYCAVQISDVAGIPDDYSCEDVPMDCSPVTCGCFDAPEFAIATCEDEGMNAVTLTYPGG